MSGPNSVDPNSFAWSYGTIAPLTGQTGTADGVISSVGATFDATAQGHINNNFKELADKVNAIIAVLQSNGTLT